MALTPTTRFSDRADDYAKYRPGYPDEVLAFCRSEMGMTPDWAVADLGSGTGILTAMFLEQGHRVFAVEPNGPMRESAERALGGRPGFTSVTGTAEATTLPAASVNLVTAATAFHWFNPAATRAEALRILRPGGWAMLVWNIRNTEGNPTLKAYDALLHSFAEEYTGGTAEARANRKNMATFFGSEDYHQFSCENSQRLDFDGLRGRMLSSSYCPKPGHPHHEPLMAGLRTLFEAHQQDGLVRLDYVTRIYAHPMRPVT